MKTTIGKLRNITTGILHTDMDDVYEFFEQYLNEKGIYTHHLPSAGKAILPILKKKLPAEWFSKDYIITGLNEEAEVPDMTEEEKKEFWFSFGKYSSELWNNNIKDKAIIVKKKINE